MLLTGRSGSGKTSILRAVAKGLQEDPRTFACGSSYCWVHPFNLHRGQDTLYVDAAKYTETPVSRVKNLLRYWFDKAYFHRPTVVIIDNLDMLIGVEQEVKLSRNTVTIISNIVGLRSMRIHSGLDISRSCFLSSLVLPPALRRQMPKELYCWPLPSQARPYIRG